LAGGKTLPANSDPRGLFLFEKKTPQWRKLSLENGARRRIERRKSIQHWGDAAKEPSRDGQRKGEGGINVASRGGEGEKVESAFLGSGGGEKTASQTAKRRRRSGV